MKIKKLIAVAVCVVLAASLFSGFAFADYNPPENGWYYDYNFEMLPDGNEYPYAKYFKDGKCLTGWQKIDGEWYYFEDTPGDIDTGQMHRNSTVGEYYLGYDGVMQTELWHERLEHKAEQKDGAIVWIYKSYDPPQWEYYDEDGKRVYGWKKLNGVWYYFHEGQYGYVDGKLTDAGTMAADEWEQVNGKWYLFGEDGAMLTGEQERNGKNYLLSESGAMYTGWKKTDDGQWLYYKADGAMAKDEWVMVKTKWYLFDENGIMRTGLLDRYDYTYYFNDSGSMATGWKKLDGVWYYFRPAQNASGPQGSMVKGSWVLSGNKWYYMGSDGAMLTGTKDIYSGNYGRSDEYYFNDSGAMQTGWHYVDSAWRYFRVASSANGPQGSKAVGCWVPAGDKWYFTDYTDGAMVMGWQDIEGERYYFSGETADYGQMVTGKRTIDGKEYTFDDDGALVK